MIKHNIICIGKIKDKYIKEGIEEFTKRISKYTALSVVELQEEDDNKGLENAINKETERILQRLSNSKGYNILLDLDGKIVDSVYMSNFLEKISITYSEVNFIIGGSNGVGENLKKYVDYKLSFSKFTFPHQLMRLILTEQIYRWIAINKNIKYHK